MVAAKNAVCVNKSEKVLKEDFVKEQVYNESYYNNYDVGSNLPIRYADNEDLRKFFENTAKKIVETFHPKTVLDAGCALGLLVKELRKLGVCAYGIDISNYAVSNADPEIREFCRECSIAEKFPEDFPSKFDLITNIEVMEHLPEDSCDAAIKNLCEHTDRVIFSSTSTDFEDPTHINVRSIPYWAQKFAENGFYNRIDNYPSYISADAYCFEKSEASFAVERYEKQLSDDKKEKSNLEYLNSNLETELKKERKNNEKLEKKYCDAYNKFCETSALYGEIVNSQYWRITKPMRTVTNFLKQKLKKWKITRYFFSAVRIFIVFGPKALKEKIRDHKERERINSMKIDYTAITAERRKSEQETVFPKNIKFSILVPLYNTPVNFLEEMINSVIGQTYGNWELCLADGSDSEHTDVRECAERYAKADSRIVYRKLEKNLGISENTNACIDMSTGDYIALFDHDDVLHPSALFENMKAICNYDADFVYTDEATFESPDIHKIITFHFKPDFAIDNLRANNYICHFTVFSRELLEKTGGFRSEFDGSQDHDLVLRLTSNAQKIYHIRKLLYFWRSHPQSVAMNIDSKGYAVSAGRKAVWNSIRAAGYDCVVESSKAFPTIYRIKYELKIHPLVSIIIPNKDHKCDLKRCIDSILVNSTYDNYEIIVIENNSAEKEIFDYYEELKNNENIKVINYEGEFNYSDINNFGAKSARGDYLLLLNNDTEVITPDWIEEMLMYAQRPDVGIVGAKLYYPDNTVQHAGIVVGLGGVAGHSHYGTAHNDPGYMGKMFYSQNLSAVTAACLMIRKSVFDGVGGFNCEFAVAYNDVDLCLRVRESGKLIVFTPYAELFHYESKTRGNEETLQNQKRFVEEIELFHKKWDDKFLSKGDPYYNPNFSLECSYKVLYDKVYDDCIK